MRRIVSILILLFSGTQVLLGQIFPEERFDKIYSLEFDTLNQESVSIEPYDILADNYEDFLFLLLSGIPNNYNNLKLRHSERVELIELSNASDSIKQYCISEVNLQWALVYWRYGDYVKSAFNIRKAYKDLSELQRNHPSFIEVNKSLGLMHILLSAIPEDFQWLIKFFGFENNFDRGYKELMRASSEPNNFRMESALLLSYVELFVLDNHSKGFEIVNTELEKNEKDIISFVYLVYCHKHGRNEEGIEEILKEKWIQATDVLRPMISLLKGEMFLKKLDFENAIFYLKDFLFTYNGKGLRSNAKLKLYYSYYLSGDIQKAGNLMINSDINNSDLIVSDNYAEDFFEKGKNPNAVLLKSRLLFDGGYFKLAQEEIKNFPLLSYNDIESSIEYYYRLGRINQSLNEFESSILAFEKCIELQENRKLYFAPNACLQLGYIYRKTKNERKTDLYFRKALEYKNYPYKRSIEHQAKSALNALH